MHSQVPIISSQGKSATAVPAAVTQTSPEMAVLFELEHSFALLHEERGTMR